MANWQTIEFNFDIFEPIRSPVESALQALQAIEAVLETLLALIKPFFLDISNPFAAVIALLLAAVQAIINQIESAGFSILLVHPDFSNTDFAAVLNSVSGAYPGFESKVVGKFFDTSDIFRPQYPPGSTVGMIVFYVGADSPGDLLGLLFNLLSLIKYPVLFQGLPAPIDLKVRPVLQGGDAISQFRHLFDSEVQNQLSLEWRMPQQPVGNGSSGLFNQLVGFYNQFRFPNFIIERQGPFPQSEGEPEKDVRGNILELPVESTTLGSKVDALTDRYNFPRVRSTVPVREEDGSVFRIFDSKRAIVYSSDGTSGENSEGEANGLATSSSSINASTSTLVRGIATGRYKFLDEDLEHGKTYYYRVRAFFGDAQDYLNNNQDGIVQKGNQKVIRFENMTLGQPSNVVKGFVPRELPVETDAIAFKIYDDLFRAIQAGILLNFELPRIYPVSNQLATPVAGNPSSLQTAQAGAFLDVPENTTRRDEQRTGWGTLGQLGNQIGPLKSSSKTSEELRKNIVFQTTCRRLTNTVLNNIVSNPELHNILINQWSNSVQGTVESLETDSSGGRTWGFVGIINGISADSAAKIDSYLALEDNYSAGSPITGPVPIEAIGINTGLNKQPNSIGLQQRQELAEFLRTALSVNSANTGYLAWYSVTVGDLFPDLTPFMFDFEQFLLSLVKALNSALQEITEIIETLLAQIRALEQILQTILQIIDILSVQVSVSVLMTGPTTNGSAATLVQDLINSQNKPGDSPFGLHSGIVMTFGGPGEGSVAALNALKFILGLQFL